MKKVISMLLAGGQGTRLNILANHRAKPAIPFAGNYRVIDVTLSNIMNSSIDNIGILTQYKPSSLIDHLQDGESWGFSGKNKNMSILPPYTGNNFSSWYKGTADAVYQNINYIEKFENIENVLILSGDHVYKMDYSSLVNFHRERDADITIVSKEVPIEEASRFGTILADKNDKIFGFEEKPFMPKSNLVSLGIYLFNKEILLNVLRKDAMDEKSTHDFGRDIIPKFLNKKVFSYKFSGYWRDIGTIDSYYDTNMDIIFNKKELDFDNWKVTTNFNYFGKSDKNPLYIMNKANIKNSLISEGSKVNGYVENSILSPGVIVEEGAKIIDSIVFNNTVIKSYSTLNRVIVDKNVFIDENDYIGFGELPGEKNSLYSSHLSSGITIIGKNVKFPKNMKIGRNSIVDTNIDLSNSKNLFYKDGSFITK